MKVIEIVPKIINGLGTILNQIQQIKRASTGRAGFKNFFANIRGSSCVEKRRLNGLPDRNKLRSSMFVSKQVIFDTTNGIQNDKKNNVKVLLLEIKKEKN